MLVFISQECVLETLNLLGVGPANFVLMSNCEYAGKRTAAISSEGLGAGCPGLALVVKACWDEGLSLPGTCRSFGTFMFPGHPRNLDRKQVCRSNMFGEHLLYAFFCGSSWKALHMLISYSTTELCFQPQRKK